MALEIRNSMKCNRLLCAILVLLGYILLLFPSNALGENSLDLGNGIELNLYSPKDVLDLSYRDVSGRLVFELPNGTSYFLIEDISDPSIANKGDGRFHPMREDLVLEALKEIEVPAARLDLRVNVYILPYPRKGFLSSSACGNDIFLSPGVFEISPITTSRTTTHEIGHIFQRRYAPLGSEQWTRYLDLRGISDVSRWSDDAVHENRPVEIFAEDFRCLFGGPAARSGGIENEALPEPSDVKGLLDFMVSIAGGESVAYAVSTEAPNVRALNYPNPMHSETTIEISERESIPEADEELSITVFRVDGSLVKEIYRGFIPAGKISAAWDGTDSFGIAVSSGIYLYRAKVGTKSVAGKILLLR